MNFSCSFLKPFDYCRYKVIVRYKKIPRPTSFIVERKRSKSEDMNDTPPTFFGYSLLAIPILTFCLGTWQVRRRKWKFSLMEEVNSKFYLEPSDLPTDLIKLKDMEYVPIKVKGRYLHEKEFTVGPRSLISDNMELNEKNKSIISSSAGRGYNVICPFKLEDKDLTILVNRGWVPGQYRDATKRLLGQIEGVHEITGVIRLSEKRPTFVPKNKPKENIWYYRANKTEFRWNTLFQTFK
ncbi:surfeit locus protein 1 isoform X2 [Belonocnema kinseyi]|uniref:surfeit locus protein 1 isoform X2 n=1 Tax=Belonocnema kinseyi TaxID=2817044 RepID=UPI00143D3B37|nr:surfeit locus protein 1 isoform X2 [Belonocnema kinseyi]